MSVVRALIPVRHVYALQGFNFNFWFKNGALQGMFIPYREQYSPVKFIDIFLII